MFSKSKISQSLIDAVLKVTEEDNKNSEPSVLNEGWEDMLKSVKDRAGPQPSGGSGIKQGSRYGGSKQKDKPEHDEPEDKKKKNEEVEQVDELSKSTLGSYVKSASRDMAASSRLAKDFEHGAEKSRKQNTKDANTRLANKFKDTAHKRNAGIGKAVGRLTKEDAELDESLGDDFAQMLKDKGIKHRVHGTSDQEKQRTMDKLSANKAKDDATPKKKAEPGTFGTTRGYGQGRYMGDSVELEGKMTEEGIKDTLKSAAYKVLSKVGHGSDADMRKDLQRKVGVPQTGEKPKKEELYFKDRLLESIKQKHVEEDMFPEEKMTDAQMKKREKIVLSMKSNEAGFKKKYGKRWKDVMYATATKQAMAEELQLEGEQLDEKNESHTHAAHYENDKGEWTGMNLLVAKDDDDAIKQAHEKCKEGCRLSRVERHTPIKEEEESGLRMAAHAASKEGKKSFKFLGKTLPVTVKKEETELNELDTTTDMLSGRVDGSVDPIKSPGGFKSFKVKLKGDSMLRPDQSEGGVTKPNMDNKGETAERQKITTNPGPVDIKLDDKYGKPNAHDHAMYYDPSHDKHYNMTNTHHDQHHGLPEEVKPVLKKIRNIEKKEVNAQKSDFNKKMGRIDKIGEAKDPHMDAGVGAQPNEVPWDPAGTTTRKNKGNVTDKSGAVHTPMSRAKHLAKQAMKKMKSEVLGHAMGNGTNGY